MNAKKKRSKLWLVGLLALVILTPVVILFVIRMEGELPTVDLKLPSAALGPRQELAIDAADHRSGLRKVWLGAVQNGKEVVLAEKVFPPSGLISGGLVHEKSIPVSFSPKDLGLTDGEALLRLVVQDYSWRNWGDGNRTYQERKVIIDTQEPQIEVLSRAHNIAQGGAGLVIYRLSESCPVSGVTVGERFYPGAGGAFKDNQVYMAFFALAYDQGPDSRIVLTATDFAGNQGRAGIVHHINRRRFRRDTVNISDRFLNWKMPELAPQVSGAAGLSPVDIFLKVNRDLRQANAETIYQATASTDAQVHWQGTFARLPRSANRARFADHRTYKYKGKVIDKQVHLGADLASVAHSPIPAANAGNVVFADNNGIYGNTVVIDHGFGLFSLYAHLSHIGVTVGQSVSKGEIIGKTGRTGLAGGDHLHFSMLVHQTFVNPVEWWDPAWIKNNITAKIDAVKTP